MKNTGLTILKFDGKSITEKRLGYNKSLVEFVEQV